MELVHPTLCCDATRITTQPTVRVCGALAQRHVKKRKIGSLIPTTEENYLFKKKTIVIGLVCN